MCRTRRPRLPCLSVAWSWRRDAVAVPAAQEPACTGAGSRARARQVRERGSPDGESERASVAGLGWGARAWLLICGGGSRGGPLWRGECSEAGLGRIPRTRSGGMGCCGSEVRLVEAEVRALCVLHDFQVDSSGGLDILGLIGCPFYSEV